MPENNPVHELITIEKQNQELLTKIAITQEEILEINKSQRNNHRWKLGLEVTKLLMWPLILVLSFYFSMQAIKSFTSNLAESANPKNMIEKIDLGGANEILDLLRN